MPDARYYTEMLRRGVVVRLSSWDEQKHPRGKGGRWVAKSALTHRASASYARPHVTHLGKEHPKRIGYGQAAGDIIGGLVGSGAALVGGSRVRLPSGRMLPAGAAWAAALPAGYVGSLVGGQIGKASDAVMDAIRRRLRGDRVRRKQHAIYRNSEPVYELYDPKQPRDDRGRWTSWSVGRSAVPDAVQTPTRVYIPIEQSRLRKPGLGERIKKTIQDHPVAVVSAALVSGALIGAAGSRAFAGAKIINRALIKHADNLEAEIADLKILVQKLTDRAEQLERDARITDAHLIKAQKRAVKYFRLLKRERALTRGTLKEIAELGDDQAKWADAVRKWRDQVANIGRERDNLREQIDRILTTELSKGLKDMRPDFVMGQFRRWARERRMIDKRFGREGPKTQGGATP